MGDMPDGSRGHLRDHSRKDSTARAFINTMKHGMPINLIIGKVFQLLRIAQLLKKT